MTLGVAAIGPTVMSATGLTETAIGTSWIVPAGTKSIRGVRVNCACGTIHDAVLSCIPKLRVYSTDLRIEPADILIEPEATSPVTNGNGNAIWDGAYYPLNVSCKGGETIYFYGTMYVTKTTGLWMGIDVYFSDMPPTGPQYHYKCSAATYATTVTAGAAHTDPTVYRVNGGKKITSAFGVVWQTTSTAAVGCIGKFALKSTDFKVPYHITWVNQGGGGILLAGDLHTHLSYAGHINPDAGPQLDIPISDQCAITQEFTNGPTNIVGAFVTGCQYI